MWLTYMTRPYQYNIQAVPTNTQIVRHKVIALSRRLWQRNSISYAFNSSIVYYVRKKGSLKNERKN